MCFSQRSAFDGLLIVSAPVISLNMPLMAWESTAAIDDEVTCCACAVPDPLVSGVLNPPLIGIGLFHDLCARRMCFDCVLKSCVLGECALEYYPLTVRSNTVR